MPRSKRITWLNHPHLVVAKANGGAQLFSDDADYRAYIAWLRQLVRDRLCKVFAYCLMENEVRLVVMPVRLMLSRIMQRLHGKHSSRMNSKLSRRGHVFMGRFHSLVFDQSHLLDVVRSVHLWPARKALVRRPELYPYSSHAAYVGESADGDFLSTPDVLDLLLGTRESQIRGFVRYLEEAALDGDDYGIEEVWCGVGGDAKSAQHLLKKARQKDHMLKRRATLKSIAEGASLLLGISADQLSGISRRQELVMARRLLATTAVVGGERSVTEIAEFLKRDKAQVSRLVAQGMDLLQGDRPFVHMYESLKAKLGQGG